MTAGGPLVVLGTTPLARAIAARGGVEARPIGASLPDIGGSRVVIDDADDLATLATMERVLDAGQSGVSILAQVGDPILRAVVAHHLDARELGASRPRLFAAESLTAQRLVATVRLHEVAFWRGQDRVHVAILGWGRLGRACLEAIIPAGLAGGLGRPALTVLAEDIAAAESEIRSSYPDIGGSADLTVARLDATTLDGREGSRLTAAGATPLTAVVLALPFTTALAVAHRLRAHGRLDAILCLAAAIPLPALALLEQDCRDLARRIVTVDPLGPADDLLADLAVADLLPRRMHEAYVARFGAAVAGQGWDTLAESYKAANRSAAAHLGLKLWSLGLVPGADPDPCAVEPHALAALTGHLIEAQAEDAAVRQLARLEHDRWSAERRLDGWRYGAPRDDAARRHPALVPFDDPRLTADEIAKDVGQVRFVLGSTLHSAPRGWAAPLVLAVTADAPAGAAIDRSAAIALVQDKPWRPVTLLCALHSLREIEAVQMLVDHLERCGSVWRLIVPGTGAARRPTAAAALLARPHTMLAPLSGRAAGQDAAWIDPGAPAGDAELQNYLADRATALVGVAPP